MGSITNFNKLPNFVAGIFTTSILTFMLFSGHVSAAAPSLDGSTHLQFDGQNDYVDLNKLDVSGAALTIEAWFNGADLKGCVGTDCEGRLVSKATGTGRSDHYWMVSTFKVGSHIRLRFRLKTNNTTKTLIANSGNLDSDTWYHVAATYDGSTMRLYLDGNIVGSKSKSGLIDSNPNIDAWIGKNPGSNNRAWEGLIDEVRIWNVARNQAEIQANTDIELTGNETGLVAYYSLNEGTGQTANDASPNNNTATLGSSASTDNADPIWQNVGANTDTPDTPVTPDTPDTQAPTISTNLAASSVTSDTLVLSWNPSIDNVGVDHYDIYRDGAVVAMVTTLSYTDTGLTQSTTYQYYVVAVDLSGQQSSPSTSINVTTGVIPDTQAPSTPKNVVATKIAPNQVDLDCDPSTDNVGVDHYIVENNGIDVGQPTSTTFNDVTVTPNTTYTYVIYAQDAAGNRSNGSNAIVVQTGAVAKLTISNIRAEGITATKAVIKWDTNNPGNSQVEYGFNSSYGNQKPSNGTLVTSHSVDLTGLSADTTYHYRVTSKNVDGTKTVSGDNIFTTSQGTNSLGPLTFAPEKDLGNGAILGLSVVDLADVNGDGLLDVGVFEGGQDAGGRVTLAWLESPAVPNGNWNKHDLPRPQPSRPFIGAAKFGDMDNDGDADIVVSMDNKDQLVSSTKSAYVYWLQNPGASGNPSNPNNWTIHTIASNLPVHHINDMTLADMDGDGKLDVVVRANRPNQLFLFFQDNATTWFKKSIDTIFYGNLGEGFAIGDIDGKGQLDITLAGHWLEAPANPRGQSYSDHGIDTNYKIINQNTKEDIGDINGDGYNDVIISPAEGFRNQSNHVLAWYEAPVDPTSTNAWTRHVLLNDYNNGHTVKLVDMDNDGDLDIIGAVSWSLFGQTQNIKIWYYDQATGSYGIPQTLVTGKGLYTGVVGDIDNDGDMDIVGQETYSGISKPYLYENLLR